MVDRATGRSPANLELMRAEPEGPATHWGPLADRKNEENIGNDEPMHEVCARACNLAHENFKIKGKIKQV